MSNVIVVMLSMSQNYRDKMSYTLLGIFFSSRTLFEFRSKHLKVCLCQDILFVIKWKSSAIFGLQL